MEKNKGWIAVLCVLLFFGSANAQVHRYVVHFSDKKGTPYYISQPEKFLSHRSIQRRKKHSTPITESDLPVSTAYLNQLTATGAELFYTSRWMNLALVQADAKLLGKIDSLPFVTKVEYVAPGDKLAARQLEVGPKFLSGNESDRTIATTAVQNNMLSLQHMHSEELLGKGVLIAVFDAGFQGVDTAPFFSHLHQNRQIRHSFNFVSNTEDVFAADDHGTRVLSVLAANMVLLQNGDTTRLMGSSPEADFALYLTEDVYGEYRIEEYNWLFAAEEADSLGADIIQSSLGYSTFSDPSMNYAVRDMNGQTAVCTRAANMAAEKGIFVVSSAGNQGRISWQKITAPADSPNVLAVGAIDASGSLAAFSSLGPTYDGRIKPEVVAMGQGVTVGTKYGTVTTASGTSFSSPIVSGLVAGLIQANPHKSRKEIYDDIISSASQSAAPDTLLGYGIPDFVKAINNRLLSVDKVSEEQVLVYPNPLIDNKVNIKVNRKLGSKAISITLYDINGRLLKQEQYNSNSSEDVYIFEKPGLAPGIYFLKLSSPTFEKQVKIFKN